MSDDSKRSLSEIESFLSDVEFFSAFTDEEINRLAELSESRHFAFGDTVLERGTKCAGVYVIRKGTVRLFSTENGKEKSLGVRKDGDVT